MSKTVKRWSQAEVQDLCAYLTEEEQKELAMLVGLAERMRAVPGGVWRDIDSWGEAGPELALPWDRDVAFGEDLVKMFEGEMARVLSLAEMRRESRN